jgi:hypothetical protein
MKKFTVPLGFAVLTAVLMMALFSCERPTAADYQNPYDPGSEQFVATPGLSTRQVSEVLAMEARSGGTFTNDYGSPVTQKGVCWSTSENPTTEDQCTIDGDGLGSFESSMSGLRAATQYHARAYATNADATAYGEQRSFTTMTGVTEFDISEPFGITATSVRVDVEVKADGGAPLLDWGVCLATQSGPTVDDLCLSAGSLGKMRVVSIDSSNQRDMVSGGGIPVGDANGIAAANASGSSPETLKVLSKGGLNLSLEISQTGSSASFSVENIQAGVRYYVRAYGYNEAVSHHYSQERTFSTFSGIADVDTRQISAITAFTAVVRGAVTSGNGAEVTGRGVCLVLADGVPGLDDTCIAAGQGLGEFSVDLTDLTPQQSYSVRAYATTSIGTGWGEVVGFSTLGGIAEVSTSQVSAITALSARVGGNVITGNGAAVTSRGVCLVEGEGEPGLDDTCIAAGQGLGEFSIDLTDLTPLLSYSVRAYATTSIGTGWGEVVGFSTLGGIAEVSTSQVSAITALSARVGGNVITGNGAAVTSRGVCLVEGEGEPGLDDTCIAAGQGLGEFSIDLTDLTPLLSYSVRAYATTSIGTGWGEVVGFSTLGGIAEVSTSQVSAITALSARVGGNVITGNGAAVTSRGVCLVEGEGEPGLDDTCIAAGQGLGEFSVDLTDLTPQHSYSVRAYAKSSVETAWGEVVRFSTRDGIIQLTTLQASAITAFTANVGGSITNDGGSPVSERGVCYGISENPTIADLCVESSNTYSVYEVMITGLELSTMYHFRSYASNAVGSQYGDNRSFITRDGVIALNTAEVSSVTATTAIVGGEIADDGGSLVTNRGVCYAISENPTKDDTCLESGQGIGTFTLTLTGLNLSTTYYVSTYATNAVGTQYVGNESFTTRDGVIEISTLWADCETVRSSSAVVDAYIHSDGGASITSRGFCYNTVGNPRLNTSTCIQSSSSSGVGHFKNTIFGLSPATTYFVMAYATNVVGTWWGGSTHFTTGQGCNN